MLPKIEEESTREDTLGRGQQLAVMLLQLQISAKLSDEEGGMMKWQPAWMSEILEEEN